MQFYGCRRFCFQAINQVSKDNCIRKGIQLSDLSIIRTKRGKWVFIAPVTGVELFNREYKTFPMQRVTLVDKNILPFIRKRFHIPQPISQIKKRLRTLEIFDKSETLAVVPFSGTIENIERKCLELVRNELAILSMSRLGYSKRRHHMHIGLHGDRPLRDIRYVFIETQGETRTGRIDYPEKCDPLRLNNWWKNFHKRGFFFKFLQIINKKIKVHHTWRKTLCQAALLIGQSQNSYDIAQSFLWNIIVLEMLLTRHIERVTDALPKHIEAFIGWINDWETAQYERRIHELYRKRCTFVHTGNAEKITIEDVLFSDDLVFNVLFNIVTHIDMFQSKDDIITFVQKIEAERILGINPKVRPKTLQFLLRRYQEEDYQEI